MALAVNSVKRAAGGVPGLTMYTNGNGGDPARRVIVRESSNSNGSENEWALGYASAAEVEWPRGLVLAREMTGGGSLTYRMVGALWVAAASTGNLTLNFRSVVMPDLTSPMLPIGGTFAYLSHVVPIAAPGGSGGTQGSIIWEVTLYPQNNDAPGNYCLGYSKVIYQRYQTDNLITHQYEGDHILSLGHMRNDTLFMASGVKAGATLIADCYVRPTSFDAWVDNGQSGTA